MAKAVRDAGNSEDRPATRKTAGPFRTLLHEHVVACLTDRQYAAFRRAMDTQQVCMFHRSYAHAPRSRYEYAPPPLRPSQRSLGVHETPMFEWLNYLRYRLIKESTDAARHPIGIERAIALSNLAIDVDAAVAYISHANMGAVVNVARRFGGDVDVDDMIQELWLIMMRAINGFDVRRGRKFSTYLFGSLIRAALRARHLESRHVREFGESESLSDRPGIDGPVPEHPFDADDRLTLRDLLTEYNLTDTEFDVIARRFGLDDGRAQTLAEIATAHGCTKEWTRQVVNRSLTRLKAHFE